MCKCCEKCFSNRDIISYIKRNGHKGNCDYCHSKNVFTIGLEPIGLFIRECFHKAFEHVDTGTGAMWDPDEKEYLGPDFLEATKLSIVDILEGEGAFSRFPQDELIKDIIKASGPTDREILQGAYDEFQDINAECFVLKHHLYGVENLKYYHLWDYFKFLTQYYNRFFDVDGMTSDFDIRRDILDKLQPVILEYDNTLPANTAFFRARCIDDSLIQKERENKLIKDKEFGPPPPPLAGINRMNPVGIPYLYVGTSKETVCKECNITSGEVYISEFRSTEDLQIIDFSNMPTIWRRSIFSEEYDHDMRWFGDFLYSFVKEISEPVDSNIPDRDRLYKYTATQIIAEYIRGLGYDGIGYKSSVGEGICYCFFYGPDAKYCDEYKFISWQTDQLPTVSSFLERFKIISSIRYLVIGDTLLKQA